MKDASKEQSASKLVKEVEKAAGKKEQSNLVKKAEKLEKKMKMKVTEDDVKTNLVEEIQKQAAKRIAKLQSKANDDIRQAVIA